MKTILIPVDFSEGSLNSCKYAIRLAGQEECTFHLFHIYNDQVMIPDSSFPSGLDTDVFFNSDVILGMKEQAEKNMHDLIESVEQIIKSKNINHIKLEYSLAGGDPQWEITETCEDLHPDLLIMGTRGQGKKGFLEGSMAEKIMGKAQIPVIAVPEDYQEFHFKNLLYPTNFNKLDIDTLQRVFHLFKHLPFVIHVCHFLLDGENNQANVLMDELKKAFEKERLEGKIKFSMIASEKKDEVLETFVHFNKIDLIAFLSEKKHLIKDLFKQELHKKDFFRLELPMLAMH
jgi:nucleotide-binding universal stress UspA family protein